ncbi:MAG: hypothetical protein KAJ18_01580 [Candidatus Omnitrophica bacterium]|nr:hypothetical protein [Candidatus Omnitrophota bacterium]
MKAYNDIKKEWPKIKKQLAAVSKEALDLLKKGEKELVRVSHQGKLHMDATALNLKKEHLFHLIGKEYVKAGVPAEPNQKLKKFIQDEEKIEKELKALKIKIKEAGTAKKKEAVKKVPVKKVAKKKA